MLFSTSSAFSIPGISSLCASFETGIYEKEEMFMFNRQGPKKCFPSPFRSSEQLMCTALDAPNGDENTFLLPQKTSTSTVIENGNWG